MLSWLNPHLSQRLLFFNISQYLRSESKSYTRCCRWNSRRLAKLSVIRLIRCQLDDSVKLTVWLARKLTFSLELRQHQIKRPNYKISLIYIVSFLPIMLPIQVSESNNSFINWMLHPIVMPISFLGILYLSALHHKSISTAGIFFSCFNKHQSGFPAALKICIKSSFAETKQSTKLSLVAWEHAWGALLATWQTLQKLRKFSQ